MTENKIRMSREKHIIHINIDGNPEKFRYDLKNQCLEKMDKKGAWWQVNGAYKPFSGFSLRDIECQEEHFKNMIYKTKNLNPYCKSIFTFLKRLKEGLLYENYIQEGIDTECRVDRGSYGCIEKSVLTKPLSFYKKDIISIFKKYQIQVTCDLEKAFVNDYELLYQLFLHVDKLCDGDREKMQYFNRRLLSYGWKFQDLKELIRNGYEPKALMNYLCEYLLPFEDIPIDEGVTLLQDYYNMAKQIGREVKKYPKYLKSMHDIISANFKAYKTYYDETRFKNLAKKHLEFENKDFCVIVPNNSKEVISEGTSLNHCVGSYIEKILKEQTYIFFLRKTEKKEESLITLELIGNKITQAKGSYNRLMTEEERKFMQKYCNQLNIELAT